MNQKPRSEYERGFCCLLWIIGPADVFLRIIEDRPLCKYFFSRLLM